MLVYYESMDFYVQRTLFFHARKEKKLCLTKIMSRSAISSWGPCGWTFLHTASYAYPDNPLKIDKENMFKFLWYFARVIPCGICRKDFTQYIAAMLPELENSTIFDSKTELVRFLIDAHNYVNRKLGKREYTYHEVDEIYLFGESRAISISLIIAIVVVIALVTCVLIHTKYTKRELPYMTKL
tara:strand:- start:4501 stop:5049 length:549 start_codon:yes stop_codon:yes gene_type:complete